jgi:hypothetical protein
VKTSLLTVPVERSRIYNGSSKASASAGILANPAID